MLLQELLLIMLLQELLMKELLLQLLSRSRVNKNNSDKTKSGFVNFALMKMKEHQMLVKYAKI
jgi:hypothetical protein